MNFKIIFFITVFSLITGCGDDSDITPTNNFVHPKNRPALPDQIRAMERMVSDHPSLEEDLKAAKEDGVITKGELLSITNKAVQLQRAKRG